MTLYTLQLSIGSFTDSVVIRYFYVFSSIKKREDFYRENGKSLALHYLYENEDDPHNHVTWIEGQVSADSHMPIYGTHCIVRYVTPIGYQAQLEDFPRVERLCGTDFAKQNIEQFTVLPYEEKL